MILMYRIVILPNKNPLEIYYGEEELLLQKLENGLDDSEKRTVLLLKSKDELEEYLNVVYSMYGESSTTFTEIK